MQERGCRRDVGEGGEGEGEACSQLDALDYRNRDRAREEREQVRDAEECDGRGDEYSRRGDFRWGEVFGQSDGGDGFHGLDGEGDAECGACENVGEAGDEEGAGGGDLVVGD